ncbi:MAG: DUF2818 family protein [Thiobacillus sp.]|jgi:hypothetical protein|nr:DUF2818 family protein [Thiobacillus sp.]
MHSAIDNVQEFQRRRKQTWAAAKPWLLLLAVSVGVGLAVGNVTNQSSQKEWAFFLLAFILFFASVVRLVFIVRALYRCPACGEVPMSGWANIGPHSFGAERGVDLNPVQCSRCGAKLK